MSTFRLLALPTELKFAILHQLDKVDQVSLGQTCRDLRSIVSINREMLVERLLELELMPEYLLPNGTPFPYQGYRIRLWNTSIHYACTGCMRLRREDKFADKSRTGIYKKPRVEWRSEMKCVTMEEGGEQRAERLCLDCSIRRGGGDAVVRVMGVLYLTCPQCRQYKAGGRWMWQEMAKRIPCGQCARKNELRRLELEEQERSQKFREKGWSKACKNICLATVLDLRVGNRVR